MKLNGKPLAGTRNTMHRRGSVKYTENSTSFCGNTNILPVQHHNLDCTHPHLDHRELYCRLISFLFNWHCLSTCVEIQMQLSTPTELGQIRQSLVARLNYGLGDSKRGFVVHSFVLGAAVEHNPDRDSWVWI